MGEVYYLDINEFEKKRPPPRIEDVSDGSDVHMRDDYIGCDHVLGILQGESIDACHKI